jgi:hypothetical protein
MTDYPELTNELRPRVRLKKHTDATANDAQIEANSRRIGQRWGASTSLLPEPEVPAATPVISIRGYIPKYLDDELALRAAERRVTKTFLIVEALAKAGYTVLDTDLVEDRRKRPKGN